MRKDEFNNIEVTNEKEGFAVEFGKTQSTEYSSYSDNSYPFKDEINDNEHTNGDKRSKASLSLESEQSAESEEVASVSSASTSGSSASNAASSGAAASTGASIAAVAGASVIAVTTLSTLVGVNVFIRAQCNFEFIEPSPTSISYMCELTDTFDDKIVISLENKLLSYYETQELEEGFNKGFFEELTPDTEYKLSVLDTTYDNYPIYEKTVTTLIDEPYQGYLEFNVPNRGADFENNTFTLYMSYDEYYADYYDQMTLVVMDVEERQKEITIDLAYQQTVSMNVGEEDPMFYVEDYDGFYFYIRYLFNNAEYMTETIHVRFLSADAETYMIYFLPGEGTGEMDPEEVIVGEPYFLPECLFTPPKGFVFNGWEIDGKIYAAFDEYSVEGTTYATATYIEEGLNTDMALIEFYPGDGSGSMSPIERPVGEEYEIPDCDFLPPTDYVFDYWLDSNGEIERHPGEIVILEESGLFLTAMYRPANADAGFSFNNFYINYIDAEEGVISYTYDVNDPNNELSNVQLVISEDYSSTGSSSETLTFDLTFETNGDYTNTIEGLTSDQLSFIDYSICDYTLLGSIDGEAQTVLSTGSFSGESSRKYYFNAIVGDAPLMDEGEYPWFYRNGTPCIPLTLYLKDKLGFYPDNKLYLSYSYNGDDSYSPVLIDAFEGTQYVNLDIIVEEGVFVLDYLKITDMLDNTLLEASGLGFSLTPEATIYGFNMDIYSLFNNPSAVNVQLVSSAATFEDFDPMPQMMTLSFQLFNSLGVYTSYSYSLNIVDDYMNKFIQSDDSSEYYFVWDLTSDQYTDYQEMLALLPRYVCNVEITYSSDSASVSGPSYPSYYYYTILNSN